MARPVEVAVIGGGVMGCATTWQLAKRGVSCALIERRSFGNGASGASAGVVGPLWHLDPDNPALFGLGMRSLDLFPEWAAELTEAGVNPEFQQTGVMKIAFTEDEVQDLQGFFDWQSRLDLGVQWLERGDILQREPEANPEVMAALYSPAEGCVRGQRFCDSLAHAAGNLGAQLYEGVEVTALLNDGNRVTGVETTAGAIVAGQVVLAAGSWSGIGGRWTAPGGPLDLPVRGVKGQRILLRRPGHMPASPVRNSAVYVLPRLDGNILVASTREEGRSDETLTAEGVATLISGATRSFPSLSDAAFVSGRAGVRPATPDGLPIIGPAPGVEGVTIATGHDAVGMMLSPGTAELVVQYLLDGVSEPLHAFRADRFGQ